MRVKIKLETKKIAGKRFYFCDFGWETSFRLWVHHSLKKINDEGEPYIEFPLKGTLTQGKSPRTVILRPGENMIYWVFIPSGWVEEFQPRPTAVFKYVYKSTHRISCGYIVETANEDPLSYTIWERRERLNTYG